MSNYTHGRLQLLRTARFTMQQGVEMHIHFPIILKLPQKEDTRGFQLFWGSRTLGEGGEYTISFPEGKQIYLHTPTENTIYYFRIATALS